MMMRIVFVIIIISITNIIIIIIVSVINIIIITSCLSPPTLMMAVSALLFDKLRIRSK